jgi:uncharacterized protein
LLRYIHTHTQLPERGIKNTLTLLANDCTLPFIARYRKEATGNLDEVAIGQIMTYKTQYEAIEKRKTSILKILRAQGDIPQELISKIQGATSLTLLEDFYLPFKKKRKTKAEQARLQGLEPLAKMIMAGHQGDLQVLAERFTSSNLATTTQALEGARHIISEWISERTAIRAQLRTQLKQFALIETSVIGSKQTDEKAQKYRDYFKWSEPLSRCPSHRLLAILRAQQEGIIRLKLTIDHDKAITQIKHNIAGASSQHGSLVVSAIEDAYKRLLFPSLSKERLTAAKNKADQKAISIFAKNLKQLLLSPPLGEKRILAIDPGFRTGCKLVCLDSQGTLKHNETIYPHAPKNDDKAAIKKISSLCDAYKIEAIAIGDGTASRETERLIKRIHFKRDIAVFVVSEAGASIYSASAIAREEFPNYDVTVRGAVSIGRRLADPLAELVKIDPKSIGVGQYQHDVDQVALKESLDSVVAHCVNAVGVNINTASDYLLQYVSGIGPKLAAAIVRFRESEGPFTSRAQIKKVPRLGAKAFEQAAGFLRIKNGQHPLDDSSVHPERYALVAQMAKDQKTTVAQLMNNSTLLQNIDLERYQTKTVGLPTLADIIKELEKPGHDIREKAKVFTFNQNIRTIEDLKPGQRLPGIVNNITAFGAFVSIGIKESGLIHISNLADEFVADVSAHVSLQQQVIVKVLEVDISRKRIQLKLDQL